MASLDCEDSFKVTPPIAIKYPAKWQYGYNWVATWKKQSSWTKEDRPVKSPPFRFGRDDTLEGCLVVHPYGALPGNNCRYISLFLQMRSLCDPLIRGSLKLKTRGEEKEMTISNATHEPGLGWGFHEMVLRFLTKEAETHYKLEIECAIVLFESKVVKGLEKLCMSDLFSDVTIVVGESRLKAHKNILSTQSPVFEAMLSSAMDEAKSNVINILDMDVDVVKEMLRFLYSGSVDDLEGSAEGLLVAADKYCLPDLKSMCEDALCKTLTVDNVSRILRLSDLHHAQQLKVKSADFIRRNMDKVQETEGWQEL